MRVLAVERRALVALAGPAGVGGPERAAAEAVRILDALGVDDGLPFVVEDDGRFDGCWSLNAYVREAWETRAFERTNIRGFHMYHLVRFLRFVRLGRARVLAAAVSVGVDDWLCRNGEPHVDLTAVTRAELKAYRAARDGVVRDNSLATEMGCVSAFFAYAKAVGWISVDPVPRWGAHDRNTLLPQTRVTRHGRFLTSPQARYFLERGLRGDGLTHEVAPGYPERDYALGLLLVSTGMRRREGALVLSIEIPVAHAFARNGMWSFARRGKKGVTRDIHVAVEVAAAVDVYRRTEREAIIKSNQRRYGQLVARGELEFVDQVGVIDGEPCTLTGRHRRPTVTISDSDRARLAWIRPDGIIEPLALFLGRHGLPPNVKRWDDIFTDARRRLAADHEYAPPAHVKVTPHTMRHTFAVRTLAALMQEGRARTGNPYEWLSHPLLTVQQLLGHADLTTTQHYLFAAEIWTEEVPAVFRRIAMATVGGPPDGGDPGDE